jgi:hypothetical protein
MISAMWILMRNSSTFFLDLLDFLDLPASCLIFSETASEMSLLDPGAANINDDSINPANVLDDCVFHPRRRPSGLGVLDLDAGGVLAGELTALESGYGDPCLSSAPYSLSSVPRMPPL